MERTLRTGVLSGCWSQWDSLFIDRLFRTPIEETAVCVRGECKKLFSAVKPHRPWPAGGGRYTPAQIGVGKGVCLLQYLFLLYQIVSDAVSESKCRMGSVSHIILFRPGGTPKKT